MAFVFRWLLRLTTGLLVLAFLAFLLIYYFASRSLPDYNADHQVAGLSAPLEIVRDNANVPHIFGETDSDVFFGLGYAHAQDRLWQMMMLRRTAQGRLSELFGERTLNIDKLIRRLDLYGVARQSVEVQDERTMAALKAYAAGVNARMTQVNEQALGRGAPEFFLFSNQIAPWQPADSIAIIKLMSLQLSAHLEEEVLRARTSLILPQERLLDILPDAPGDGIAAMPSYSSIMPGLPQYSEAADQPFDPLSPFLARPFAGASNVWAADPSRAAAGGTLLANDPHLGFTAPAIWYLARVELEAGGVIGGTIPGVPVILVGRTKNLGWGLTTAYADDQDVYLEELNPTSPNEYRTPDGFKPFRTRPSIINVKDADQVTIDLRWTENGPVLPGSHYGLGTIIRQGYVTSLAWTALSPADTSLSAGMALMRSNSIIEGMEATKDYIAPVQNLVLADQNSIALKTIGAIPKRNPLHQTQGRLPSPGWVVTNRWQGRLDYSLNPEVIAPDGGILGNTNNKVTDRPFPEHVSFFYPDSQRILRWRKLMQDRKVHTRESFIEAQLDTVSNTAVTLLSLVGADLWFTGEAAPDGTPERRRQDALALLGNWNGEMNEHMPEPLLYAAWLRALQDRLIQDELGPLTREFTHVEPLFIERVYRDVDGAAVWCDVVQSSPIETCAEMAQLALDDALVWIDETYGTTLESLRWGNAHEATHDHPVLGDTPGLSWFVNIRQSTSGGDNTLLRGRTIGTGPDPFLNVHGAAFRGVYDFADPDSSVFIISTGQSGHPLSRYYDDLGQLWRRGEYIPMSLDPDLARAAAVGVTVLTPR
ncbi:penicillin acylase family protein [Parasulfitobacter algicola]|uniref:Penicillin acylase family protein n=1 Tax=Parasulfitobacter algicola TaxID=2614809 RepID=A0ABX2IQS3_9RHOB|nr:penicillin acylase family protein [Sulfitobacter algicola]NSX55242.1 penicillin acylase family protein [Sulfitobacter algicola]